MHEYNIQIKVKNNFLLSKMREFGFETAAALSRASGVQQGEISSYLNLSKTPIWAGGVCRGAELLCEFLACSLTDIFPQEHLYHRLTKNKGEVTVSSEVVHQLMRDMESEDRAELLVDARDQSEVISNALDLLTHRERSVLKARFGFDGTDEQTLEEVGQKFNVSRDRIRQIEQKALRKLRGAKSTAILQTLS